MLKGDKKTGIPRKLHTPFVLGSPASILDPDMCYPESRASSFNFSESSRQITVLG
jgi:hypothetical protein